MPAQGVNYHEYLQKRFSRKITLEHAHDVISRTAKTVDIEFDFNRINLIPNTIDSHRMVRLANRQNQAAEMLEAIYQHYFLLGCDIGDRSVLIHIGTKLGYNSKKIRNYLYSDKDILDVKKQNHHAQRLGINGVPAFVFDQQFSISGAHEPNILKKILDIAKDSLID